MCVHGDEVERRGKTKENKYKADRSGRGRGRRGKGGKELWKGWERKRLGCGREKENRIEGREERGGREETGNEWKRRMEERWKGSGKQGIKVKREVDKKESKEKKEEGKGGRTREGVIEVGRASERSN